MLRNYLKIALRIISRNYKHTILNISGMAIGMASAILILLWVENDLSWDRHYKNADDIYRVIVNNQLPDGPLRQEANTPVPLSPVLKEDYPGIIRSTRYINLGMDLPKGTEQINEEISLVDTDFFEMFDVAFIRGDINTAFTGPYNLILTEEKAEKFFGEDDPIGKTLTYKGNVLTITGIVKRPQSNSSVQYGFLLPYETSMRPGMEIGVADDWLFTFGTCFVQLNEDTDSKIIEDKIKYTIKRHHPESEKEIFLQNLKMIHLHSVRKYFGEPFLLSNLIYIQLGSLIAILIISIACINFMNMLTAQSSRRAKEIGVRKVAGASRRKIVFQYLGETLLMVSIAHIIAMVLVELLLPGFSNFLYMGGTEIEINYESAGLYIGLLGVVILSGFLAGSYPALYLSSIKPSNILKGKIDKYTGKGRFRRILVIFQITLSFLFILCTLIIRSQLNYIQSNNSGLNMENMAHFGFSEDIQRQTLKNELGNIPEIIDVTITAHQNVMNTWATVGITNWNGKDKEENIYAGVIETDMNFAETFDLQVLEGQFFTSDETLPENKADFISAVINEKALEMMRFSDPIGEELATLDGWKFRIVGVVEDFNFKNLRYPVDPLIIMPIESEVKGGTCYIRMKPGHDLATTINNINGIFDNYHLDYSPDIMFPEDDLAVMYHIERRAGAGLGFISILTIIISCLGLLGLVTLIVEHRTKEIGIRKANGANSGEIVSLLSKEYIKLVFISFIIASPIAWYATNIWLQGFVHRTKVGWQIFALAFVIIVFFTILTVGYQSYKAANRNPVEALRYE